MTTLQRSPDETEHGQMMAIQCVEDFYSHVKLFYNNCILIICGNNHLPTISKIEYTSVRK